MEPLYLQIAQMVDILPEPDKKLAFELVKKLVLAWDPDYTKATPVEAEAMNQAIKEIEAGKYVLESEIDWDYTGERNFVPLRRWDMPNCVRTSPAPKSASCGHTFLRFV